MNSLNATPEANKMKTKQLTLFEISSNSNSKFVIQYDQELMNKKAKKTPSPTKKLKTKSSNKRVSSDCEIIEDIENKNICVSKNEKSKSKNEMSARKINSQNFIKSEVNVLKEKSNRQDNNIHDEIQFLKLNESPPKGESVKKPGTNLKEFFSKSQANQSKKDPVEVSNIKETEKIIEAVKHELAENILMKKGNLYSANTKSIEKDSDLEIQNYMLGNLVMIIELNNFLLDIFGFPKSVKNKSDKMRSKIKDDEMKELKLESFIEILQSKTEAAKNSFKQYVRLLLSIVLKQVSFQELKLFEVDFKSIDLFDCTLNEICKIVICISYNLSENFDELTIVLLNENTKNKSALLKALNEDKSDAFSNLNVDLRIELVVCLLNTLVSCENFELYLEKLSDKISNLEAKLKQGESELIEKLGIDKSLFKSKTRSKYYEQASNDKKLKHFPEKLKKIRANLEKDKLMYKNACRIEPLGTDSLGHVYWYFSCFKRLVAEKKTDNEYKSEWYTFTLTQAEDLIKELELAKESSHLTNMLREKINTIYEEVVEDENKDDIVEEEMPEIEEIEKADIKSQLKQFEKRVTRSFKKTQNDSEDEEKNGSEDEKNYVKIVDPIEKDLHENNEIQIEWISTFKTAITIEDLLLLIANQQLFFDFHGILKHQSIDNLKSSIESYILNENFQEKFKKLKEIMTCMFNNTWHMMFFSKLLSSGRLGYWKQCVDSSESLSNLFFLAYIFFKILKWEFIKKRNCKSCCKKDESFKRINSLKEIINKDLDIGYYYCIQCHLQYCIECIGKNVTYPAHQKRTKSEDRYTNTGLFVCKSCDEGKKNFTFVDDSTLPKNTEEVSDQSDDENRKLRKRRQIIDYAEPHLNAGLGENRRNIGKRNSSGSSSRSSLDDISLVKKKEKSTQKSSVQLALPTRSSSRINQNSKPNYTFNNENESDEEN